MRRTNRDVSNEFANSCYPNRNWGRAELQERTLDQSHCAQAHSDISDRGSRTMITEIPAPACVGSSSPFLSRIRATRYFFNGRLHPTDTWQRPDVPVQVTGVGFFDYLHGQSGVAPTGIELHPVLSFKVSGVAPRPPPSKVRRKRNGRLSVSVSPNHMPYNAYPTLTAHTRGGASCTASIVYSTGREPKSFDGSARTANGSGTVSWTWHEETKGSGGTAVVSCTLGPRSGSGSASFSVG
jgi:hypothetical protein